MCNQETAVLCHGMGPDLLVSSLPAPFPPHMVQAASNSCHMRRGCMHKYCHNCIFYTVDCYSAYTVGYKANNLRGYARLVIGAHILGLPEAWSGKRLQQVCSTQKLQLSMPTALIQHLLPQVSQHLDCLCPTRLL